MPRSSPGCWSGRFCCWPTSRWWGPCAGATRAPSWRGSRVLGGLVSIWWIAPLLVHVRYGVDFLQFTEQPRAIWGTNSAPEALRLMAYWTSYIGVGFYGAQYALYSEAGTLLFNPLAVGASLVLPALAVGGYALTRRSRYAPFLLLLLLVGTAIEVAGFPNGTPAREAMEWVYRNVSALRFLRTTQKAAPLVAIGVGGSARAPRARRPRARAEGSGRPWMRRGGAVRPGRRTGAARSALGPAARARGRRGAAARLEEDPRRVGARRPAISTASFHGTAARSCCRGRSSPTTCGAARSTRSSRGSPSGPWRCASRRPTPTRTRPTSCGPWTGSCSSAASCPRSSCRCCA